MVPQAGASGRRLSPSFALDRLHVLCGSLSKSESHFLLCKTRVTSTRRKGGGTHELLDAANSINFSETHKCQLKASCLLSAQRQEQSPRWGLGDVLSDGFCSRILGRIVYGWLWHVEHTIGCSIKRRKDSFSKGIFQNL